MRMRDLYGEEGEVILDQLEKREGGYFADLQRDDR
jgi:syntaxin 16